MFKVGDQLVNAQIAGYYNAMSLCQSLPVYAVKDVLTASSMSQSG